MERTVFAGSGWGVSRTGDCARSAGAGCACCSSSSALGAGAGADRVGLSSSELSWRGAGAAALGAAFLAVRFGESSSDEEEEEELLSFAAFPFGGAGFGAALRTGASSSEEEDEPESSFSAMRSAPPGAAEEGGRWSRGGQIERKAYSLRQLFGFGASPAASRLAWPGCAPWSSTSAAVSARSCL